MASSAPMDGPVEAAPIGPVGLGDPLLLREWFLVAWSSEIEPGKTLARRALGRDLVIWRSSKGLHCWLDLCIHRGAKLSLGRIRAGGENGECLICPYHAWEYGPSGQCVRIPAHPDMTPPAKARVQAFRVRERYGAVWVCLGEPHGDVPEFAFAETPGFRTIPAGPYVFHALGPRVIENVLDVAHLGYVHAGLLGDPQRLEVEDYEVNLDGVSVLELVIKPDLTHNDALATLAAWRVR